MFSAIFGKKKTADTPPEEIDPIPSHDAPTSGGDEFVFINQKDPVQPQPPPPASMYPTFPPGAPRHSVTRQDTMPTSYLQGVPFKLASELCSGDHFGTVQMEIDGILALMTRQLHFSTDYDFNLERSLLG